MHMHKLEKIWLSFGILTLAVFLIIVGINAFQMGHHPPSHIATINYEKVDVTPPFNNPGLTKVANNEYQLVIVASAFSYVPQKIEIPKGAIVHIKATTKDVVHGFEVAGTNINMMLEPGYISEYTQQFNKPGKFLVICNEYCGAGHHLMFANIEVIEQ